MEAFGFTLSFGISPLVILLFNHTLTLWLPLSRHPAPLLCLRTTPWRLAPGALDAIAT